MTVQSKFLLQSFQIPLFVLVGIFLYGILLFFHLPMIALVVILVAIILGSYQLFQETYHSLRRRHFALDYIAILAILVSLITSEYLVGAVIALMIASGRTLEAYGAAKAKASLTQLTDRIPRDVVLWKNNAAGEKVKIEDVRLQQEIFIRKGEVIPLDGILMSEHAIIDESSLTGESYPVEKLMHDGLISGTVNVGNPLVMKITKEEKDSTYKKIIDMVQKAQEEKAPLVRLADRYSTIFTIVTFVIAAFAFFHTKNLQGVLAVLVVATPCPLILATPIALLGGVNAAAKKRMIVKKLASLEVLSRVRAVVFDKTGTITLGTPKVVDIKITDKQYTPANVLAIAQALERNSLHPLAKAIVAYAQEKKVSTLSADNVTEIIGKGIQGIVKKKTYTLEQFPEPTAGDMAICLKEKNKQIALFIFADEMKKDAKTNITKLKMLGIQLAIFTGDKKERGEKLAKVLDISVKSECSPEDKQQGILQLQKQGLVTAMFGDGINDAPALALADVGIVFTNGEQTASSAAADIIFLHGNFSLVFDIVNVAKRTIAIALQSILWGIGLSIAAMIAAAFGLIPPLTGAILQEAIDVAVILNALRASV